MRGSCGVLPACYVSASPSRITAFPYRTLSTLSCLLEAQRSSFLDFSPFSPFFPFSFVTGGAPAFQFPFPPSPSLLCNWQNHCLTLWTSSPAQRDQSQQKSACSCTSLQIGSRWRWQDEADTCADGRASVGKQKILHFLTFPC
jgi:hypothetical protein